MTAGEVLLSSSSTAIFWVCIAQDGAAKIHHVACVHAQDGDVAGKRRVKAENIHPIRDGLAEQGAV